MAIRERLAPLMWNGQRLLGVRLRDLDLEEVVEWVQEMVMLERADRRGAEEAEVARIRVLVGLDKTG
jgi:hypothetical protein